MISGVPRVSDAHREQRRQQILDAARRRFARNGFHQTSMQDILAEAGLSAGALYRYFRSKEEIIAAIAEEALAQVTAPMGPLAAQQPAPPLDAVIERLLTNAEDVNFLPDGLAYIAPQVWAEALRNPRLRELVQTKFAEVRSAIAGIVRAEQTAGRIPADADPDDVAGFLFGSLLGYVLQRVLAGTVDPRSYSAALRALVARPDTRRLGRSAPCPPAGSPVPDRRSRP
jgi:AcrR family transcriptional regulator